MVFWAFINLFVSAMLFWSLRSNLFRTYLVLNFVLIVNPAFMWAFFGQAHPKFIPGHDSYSLALAYMACFNLVLGSSFAFLMRYLPPWGVTQRNLVGHRINTTEQMTLAIAVAVFLAVLGFLGKLLLDSMGALRMLGGGGGGPFLQALKVFSGFDLMAILLLGEIRNTGRARVPVVTFLVVISFAFALFSGSRAQTITILIVTLIVYRSEVHRFRYIIYPALMAIVPVIFVVFPLLGYYRISNYSFAEARYLVEQMGLTPSQIMAEIFVTRLNYLEPLARVVDYVAFQGPAGGSVYWNNIIGAIPRLIWPGKPLISNDSQLLGHQLGLVSLNDESTSIGLRVVGESFFEYGWIGLWVAVFQAAIFAFAQRNFYRPGNPAVMTIYILFCFYILRSDGYFAIIPGLIWFFIGAAMFFFAFTLMLRPPGSNDP